MKKTTSTATFFAQIDMSGWNVQIDVYGGSRLVYIQKGLHTIMIHDDGFHVVHRDGGAFGEMVSTIGEAVALCKP